MLKRSVRSGRSIVFGLLVGLGIGGMMWALPQAGAQGPGNSGGAGPGGGPFAALDARLNAAEARLDAAEARLDAAEARADAAEARADEAEARADHLEDEIVDLWAYAAHLQEGLWVLEARLAECCPEIENPCDTNPGSLECHCFEFPDDKICAGKPNPKDPCATDPNSKECIAFCKLHPKDPRCQANPKDPCATNPGGKECLLYCNLNPKDPRCHQKVFP